MPDPAPTYWEQPELNQTATEGANTATRNFKGSYADPLTFANGLTIGGSPYGGLPLRAVNITRTVASLATLRLEYGKETSYDAQKTATETSVNWSMKHTQRIVSLMRRTGDSASMPHRGNLEAWRKEPDPALYDAFQYRGIGGGIRVGLGGADCDEHRRYNCIKGRFITESQHRWCLFRLDRR